MAAPLNIEIKYLTLATCVGFAAIDDDEAIIILHDGLKGRQTDEVFTRLRRWLEKYARPTDRIAITGFEMMMSDIQFFGPFVN